MSEMSGTCMGDDMGSCMGSAAGTGALDGGPGAQCGQEAPGIPVKDMQFTLLLNLQMWEHLQQQQWEEHQRQQQNSTCPWITRVAKAFKRQRRNNKVGTTEQCMAAYQQQQVSLLLEELQVLEQSLLKQKEQLLQDVRATLNSLQSGKKSLPSTSTEHMKKIPNTSSAHPVLLPPARLDFSPHNSTAAPSDEALDPKEEKRRRKELLKSKKPKNMGLKRRFFLCLRCLT